MDFDRLRYFSTIAETKSMRKAAELLHISPAALSKAVKQLELEAGAKLIVPSGRGIAITDAGVRIAAATENILSQVEALRDEVAGDSKKDQPLRVGSFEVFTTYFMGPLLREHINPPSLALHELIPGALEEALKKRQIDLGITYIPIPSSELDHMRVGAIEMGIFSKRGRFKETPFASWPFAIPVSPVQGSPNRVVGLDGWPEDRINRNVKFKVTLMESALEFCRRGVAVSFLPKFVVRLHNETVKEEFQLKQLDSPRGLNVERQPVYLVKRKSDPESKLMKQVAKAIRLECRSRV